MEVRSVAQFQQEPVQQVIILTCSVHNIGNPIYTAPSGAPVSVTASVGSTYIYVYWQDADCIHRNGEITGYSVRYGEVGSSESDKIVQMIPGPNIVISGVTVYTDYTIEVATVNSAGVGVYSDPFTIYFDASPGNYMPKYIPIIPAKVSVHCVYIVGIYT